MMQIQKTGNPLNHFHFHPPGGAVKYFLSKTDKIKIPQHPSLNFLLKNNYPIFANFLKQKETISKKPKQYKSQYIKDLSKVVVSEPAQIFAIAQRRGRRNRGGVLAQLRARSVRVGVSSTPRAW